MAPLMTSVRNIVPVSSYAIIICRGMVGNIGGGELFHCAITSAVNSQNHLNIFDENEKSSYSLSKGTSSEWVISVA